MPREMVRGQLINGGGSIRDNLELPFLTRGGLSAQLARPPRAKGGRGQHHPLLNKGEQVNRARCRAIIAVAIHS